MLNRERHEGIYFFLSCLLKQGWGGVKGIER